MALCVIDTLTSFYPIFYFFWNEELTTGLFKVNAPNNSLITITDIFTFM